MYESVEDYSCGKRVSVHSVILITCGNCVSLKATKGPVGPSLVEKPYFMSRPLKTRICGSEGDVVLDAPQRRLVDARLAAPERCPSVRQ